MDQIVITKQELNPKNHPVTKIQEDNLSRLFYAMNKIREAYGKPMVVTSGFRSMAEHEDIYIRNGAIEHSKLTGEIVIRRGRKFPTQSAHLAGAACDIRDTDGKLAGWVKDNLKLMEQLGVYLEDFSCTKGWVHFQVTPPKSGNRVFMP